MQDGSLPGDQAGMTAFLAHVAPSGSRTYVVEINTPTIGGTVGWSGGTLMVKEFKR